MFFGASTLSAVKLVLGLTWDLEILDRNVMAVRGDVQLINLILTRFGVHLISMTLVNMA